jgi:hypothetical protein
MLKRFTAILLLSCASAFAAEQPRQTLPTEQDVLSGIVAQQAKANAELTVRVMRLEQELQVQRARADAAEAKARAVENPGSAPK